MIARTTTICVTTLVAILAVTAFGIALGEYPLAVRQLPELLFGGGTRLDRHIFLDLRLPRAVIGCLAGACLAMAGALTQTISRNPLATPDFIGVTAGASAGAVAVIVFGGGSYAVTGTLTALGIPAAALIGGLLAAGAVYGLSWRNGVDGYRLILIGVGAAAVLTAITSWLLVVASINNAAQAVVWLAGSLNSRTWDQALPLTVLAVVLLPFSVLLPRVLRVTQLGDDVATALGVRVQATRLGSLGLAVGLTAAAVAAAGPVAFVALVVPQIMLRLTRGSRPPLLASALGGALLVQSADLIGRSLFAWEIPVGLVTAVLGAPYLIWLLVRRK
ncbi:iron chelate uptake ABC transporter family permease subunit [Amycolatopsis acidicola]|uniref:Iron chelate uptake ABC transporter family permease subunit n=1 Tax=Amycolatopsis acidicola TaxID=2596893 RepID=A0A5N0V7B5_9PSEU|nr:iron chelate uptake ABC transporter family permease subunit [Amycolatopsis acidicola]KAA9162309.1 iron chelate uptake ABC transporter family permease subunit [Amycolatopsis acidicola]